MQPLEARADWNALGPRLNLPQVLTRGLRQLYLQGVDTQLRPGDAILIIGSEREEDRTSEHWDFRLLDTVEADADADLTRITWLEGLGHDVPHVDPTQRGVQVYALRQRAALFGHNAPDPRLLRLNRAARTALTDDQGNWKDYVLDPARIDLDAVYPKITANSWVVLESPTYTEVTRASQVIQTSVSRFALSGKLTRVVPDNLENPGKFGLQGTTVYGQSEALGMAERPIRDPVYGSALDLGQLAPDLLPGQALAFRGKRQRLTLTRLARSLTLVAASGRTAALAPGDSLEVLEAPVLPGPGSSATPIAPADLVAAFASPAPTVVRWRLRDGNGFEGSLHFQGTVGAPTAVVALAPSEDADEVVSEIALLKSASDAVVSEGGRTSLKLSADLRNCYDRAALTINANVALATHGETVQEVLGPGDASRPYQSFVLKQAPLTYVSAATPSGSKSTLAVRVNDVLWHEVPTLYGAGPRERVYISRRSDDGHTTVEFGDGTTGARLPTGRDNVRAKYRKGVGLAGLIKAGQLSQLMSRPLGVKSAVNPEDATDAKDPDTLADTRRNAPLTVLTLDRTVSLLDYEDFARTFGEHRESARDLGLGRPGAARPHHGRRLERRRDRDGLADDDEPHRRDHERRRPLRQFQCEEPPERHLPPPGRGQGRRADLRAQGRHRRNRGRATIDVLVRRAHFRANGRAQRGDRGDAGRRGRRRGRRRPAPSLGRAGRAQRASRRGPTVGGDGRAAARGRAAHPRPGAARLRGDVMSFDTRRLYDLLPAIHRVRDDQLGGPMKELLDVLAEQVSVLEENLDQLYDDQFIETCADWVVPYIGDLIGYRALHGNVPRVASPRAEVAHTIAFRRRKGTAAMLEQLARDVTGWNANVVEFFLRLSTTQYMNHLRRNHFYAPDLRQWEPLERLDSPFDTLAHTADVRQIASGDGRYNIPNVGIFLWRLEACSLTRSPAFKLDNRRYLFSPLGNDTPLFTHPTPENQVEHLATPLNVPARIRRRVLDAHLGDYYGDEKSLLVRRNGADAGLDDVLAADLSDAGGGLWAHRPKDKIAIDPVLGRIAFPENDPPPGEVLVTYHYGFADDLGGGEYDRLATIDLRLEPAQQVVMGGNLQASLDDAHAGGSVQIGDSGRYETVVSITVDAGQRLELRAVNLNRPTVVLAGDLRIAGGDQSEVTLNGLLIVGGALTVPAANNRLRKLRLRHCTLVPGIALSNDGSPVQPAAPSLTVELPDVAVEIDHCIVGGLRIAPGASVSINDSILDATDETGVAYAALDGAAPGGTLQALDCTVIGKVHTVLLDYASNVIFLSRLASGDSWTEPVRSDRRQTGCVRFSFVPLGAVVPRRYRCQPELEVADRIAARERDGTKLTTLQKAQIEAAVVAALVPRLTSRRYGEPGYCELAVRCPRQIKEGADDEAGMGAFHKLYEPQRGTNLRVRLDEFLRFGLEAGIFYAS